MKNVELYEFNHNQLLIKVSIEDLQVSTDGKSSIIITNEQTINQIIQQLINITNENRYKGDSNHS